MTQTTYIVDVRTLPCDLSAVAIKTLSHHIIQAVNSHQKDTPLIFLMQEDHAPCASSAVTALCQQLHRAYFQRPHVIYAKDENLITTEKIPVTLPDTNALELTPSLNSLYHYLDGHFTDTLLPRPNAHWSATNNHWEKPAILLNDDDQITDQHSILKIPFQKSNPPLVASKNSLPQTKDQITDTIEHMIALVKPENFNEQARQRITDLYEQQLFPALVNIQQDMLSDAKRHPSQDQFEQYCSKKASESAFFSPPNTKLIAAMLPHPSYFNTSLGAHRNFNSEVINVDEFLGQVKQTDLPSYHLFDMLYNRMSVLNWFLTQLKILHKRQRDRTHDAPQDLIDTIQTNLVNFKDRLLKMKANYEQYQQSLNACEKSHRPYFQHLTPQPKSFWSQHASTLLITALGGALVGAGLLSLALFTGGSGVALFAAHIPWIHIAYAGVKAHTLSTASAFIITSSLTTSLYASTTALFAFIYSKFKAFRTNKKVEKNLAQAPNKDSDTQTIIRTQTPSTKASNILKVQHPKYHSLTKDDLQKFHSTEAAQLYFAELCFISQPSITPCLEAIETLHQKFLNYDSSNYKQHSQRFIEDATSPAPHPNHGHAHHVKMEHILDGLTRNAPAMPCNTKQRLLAVPQRVYEIVLYLQRQRRIKAQNPETLFRCHKAYEELYNHDGFCRLVTQDPKLLELLYFNPRYNSTIGSPLNQPHYKLITKTNTYLAKNINELYSCIINNHTNNEPAIGIIDKYFEILEHTTNLTQNTHTLSLSTLILSSFQHLRNEKAENNALKEKIKSEKQQLNPSSTIKKTKSQINELSTQLQKYKNTITSIDTKLARLTPLLQKAIKHVSSAQQHADIKSKERTQQSLEFIETAQFVLSSNQPVQINTGLFSHSKHSVTAPTTEDMTQVMTA